jgi:hypothetical protein
MHRAVGDVPEETDDLARAISISSTPHPLMIGAVAVFAARRGLIDPLAQQLEQGMISMSRGSRIFTPGCDSLQKLESFIYLPHEEEAGFRRNLGALGVDGN